MPLYLCRRPNGDASVVVARNKTDAIVQLDEFDNAEYAEISRLNEFLVDFRLNRKPATGRVAAGDSSSVADLTAVDD